MRTQATHCHPRSWKFSPDGTKLLIEFVNGDLQVGVSWSCDLFIM